MRVFLTGGSGFIGRRLVARLVEAQHHVICLSRSGQSSALLSNLGADVLSGNLDDSESLIAALREAKPTHVAHLAAEIATQRNSQKIQTTNIDGTRNLIAACRDVPLEKFLFLSSVVRGDADGQTFSEDTAIPATTNYGRSKEAGDEMVIAAYADLQFPGVILRPSHVYGAGGWFAELLRSKLARMPGSGDNWWDMVHVDDVVSACLTCLENAPPGQVYHVVDDTPVTMKQVLDALADAAGRKRFKTSPVWLAKVVKGGDTIASAVRSAKSSNDKLKSLGWAPDHPTSLESIPEVAREILESDAIVATTTPDEDSQAQADPA